MTKQEWFGLLVAYRLVKQASWPQLNPELARNAAGWTARTADELERELEGYLRETEQGSEVRVFWKLLPEYTYGGCNAPFAHDAGLASPRDVVGRTDFDKAIAWGQQAGKYRRDDRDVVESGEAKLDIIERQNSAAGVIWLRTGKAPIRSLTGQVVGLLGMYEVIDAALAARLNLAKNRAGT